MTREDIDRIASEYFNDKESEHEMEEVFDLAKKALEKQIQESKTGHWIWNIDKTYCKCSKCGIGMGHTEYDYCPNCGAKMVDPREREDKK